MQEQFTERRTRAYGRLKKIACNIKDQVRNRVIHELSGLNIRENIVSIALT